MTAEQLLDEMEEFADKRKMGEFIDALAQEHRTLQQRCFVLILGAIEYWAKQYEDGNYDLRNEDTVRTCKKIWNNLEYEDTVMSYI